jgi:CRISPR-associated endoribonuclease Cas6
MPHAFLLHLSPTKKNTAPLYLNLYSHGLFYHLLKCVDPAMSEDIHAAKRKPFTLHAQQHKEEVTLRVTTLDDSLFAPLLQTALETSLSGLELGQDKFQITKVIATPEGNARAGFCSWQTLLDAPETDRLTLHFRTPTTFSTSRSDGKRQYTPLPIPALVLKSLFTSFQLYSPHPYNEQEAKAFLDTIFEEHFFLERHKIETQSFEAGKQRLTGFIGSATLRYQDQTSEVKKLLGRLGKLAFYSGIGTKTPYGMGQVVVAKFGTQGQKPDTNS